MIGYAQFIVRKIGGNLRSLPHFARQQKRAAMQFDQFLRQRQTKPGSLILAGDRAIDLLERR